MPTKKNNDNPSTSVFDTTVAGLLAQQGLDGRVRVRHCGSGDGAATVGGRTIVVGSAMGTRRTAGFQQWTAAHEVAHLVLGHRINVVAGVLAMVSLGCWIGAAAANLTGSAGWTAIFMVAGPVGLVSAFVVYRPTALRAEREADQLANRWGYPLTRAIADELAATEGNQQPAKHRTWLRHHDYPHDRITHDGSGRGSGRREGK